MDLEFGDNLLAALPLPALFVDRGERIIGANARALTIFGEQVRGRHYVTALRQPDTLDAIEECLAQGTASDTRYLTNDGNTDVTYIVNCALVQGGGLDGVLVTFDDISHLEQADQMRRDFVANVSHELRTPLTAMIGFIETLRGPARNDAEARDRFLAIMAREAARMERLVGDLLSLSRVESSERVRPTELVDLGGIVRSVLHSLAPLAEEAELRFETDMPEGEVLVPGDQDQLLQVFANLVENAIKYGGSGQKVSLRIRVCELSAAVRGPAVIVDVEDEGPGIEQVHIPRLTERFYRVDSHRSRQIGGTGLGLAIVKHIINRHRGRLKIRSDQGVGSKFSVVLPKNQNR